MIVLQFNNDNTSFSEGIACKQQAKRTKTPASPPFKDFCSCHFNCDYPELCFYDEENPDDEYKNDRTSFLFDLMDESSTFVFEIMTPTGNYVDLLSGDYGIIYPPGFNDSQKLKIGLELNWLNVFQNIGLNGKYLVRCTINNFGTESVYLSREFILGAFHEDKANGTIKIETINTGEIINGENYSGMEWYKSQRIRGKIHQYSLELNKLSNSNSSHKYIQVEDSINELYVLTFKADKSTILNPIIKNDMLATNFFVTDYNLENYQEYRKLECSVESIDSGQEYYRSNIKSFSIQLKNVNPIIKRN